MLKEKRWSKEIEKEIYEEWKDKEVYRFKKSDKPVYSIDTPPPYVNTPVHVGQATTYVLMDMFARFRRMIGYNVLFPLGLDRNGLPIEMAAEQRFNIKLNEVSREEFIKKCNIVLEESSLASAESFLRLGIGFNSSKIGTGIGEVYLTDSPDYRALTQETFIDLWNKGLIYQDERINNYCPGCRTTIADAEIEYEDLLTTFNDIIFKVKETGEEIIIGTTRPELVCTCGMVIFNPEDERYKHLDGKTAITPIFNKEVPIRAHPMAEMEKGTGLVMMCSAGDTSDIRFFREMNLQPTIAINADGTMNEHAGFLKGLKVAEAREKMVQKLREENLFVRQKKIMHRTPICERSKDAIEFIAMPEFYLKQVEFKDEMKELADQMSFFALESKQILVNWIDSVSIDWPISRRRYYATEIPLWYCKNCSEVILPPKGRYYQPWREKPPIKRCPKCGANEFKGEERVFDTWFDSSITPLYILKYSSDNKFFEKNSPCSLRPQGKEIVRTWLYYTVLKDYLLTGKCIFKDVWINFHIVDEEGHKMSKSRGNVIDPRDILDKLGAEPFRLWCAIEGNLAKTDFRCSLERIEGAGKTITKLWNVARFISMFPKADGKFELTALDKWIMQEVNELIKIARKGYEEYNFHTPAILIKHFIWETFASHYLELVKNRAYNGEKNFSKAEQNGALYALHYCLEVILRLLAPVIPLMTYRIYKELYNKDVHFSEFPKVEREFEVSFSTNEISELNSQIWKAKKERGMSLKGEIKEAELLEKFKEIEKDLAEAHGIKKVKFGDRLKLIF
ncbi:MAG: valine--tRNA ligase [Euryarchaeota archaeon]|nr:valine--tRNA ligase [Euryarchaeota archaeon]